MNIIFRIEIGSKHAESVLLRTRGLLGEQEDPDAANYDLIRAANQKTEKWVSEFSKA